MTPNLKRKRKKKKKRKNRGIKKQKKTKKKPEWLKKKIKRRCKITKCLHEKCHHLRFVKYLRWQKKKYKIPFSASLLPYQRVYHPKKYGIVIGDLDFKILLPFKNKSGIIIYTWLGIELKVGRNDTTKDEDKEIKEIIKKGDGLPSVCYGYKQCKKLMKAYRNKKGKTSLEELQELCWAGKIKKDRFI